MRFSDEIVAFANGNTDFFEAFAEYYNNADCRTAEKSEKIHNAFFTKIAEMAGVNRTEENKNAWMVHPNVQWASMAVIDAVVNSILPQTLNTTIGVFTDLRFVGSGDVIKFRVKPRSLYTVSKGAHGERTTFRQKKYASDVLIVPEEHLVTVYTDWYRVMAGKEDMAEFVRAVVTSIEAEMGKDAFTALSTGLSAASYPTAFKVSGAFNAQTLITLAETVAAYNGGVKPVILGTTSALANVTPDSSLGYRMNVDGNGGAVNLIKDFYGYPLMVMNQYAAGTTPDDGLALPDDTLFVVAPGQDKLVKGAVSTGLNNTNQHFDNADLTSNFTYRKDWKFEFISGAYGGKYQITA